MLALLLLHLCSAVVCLQCFALVMATTLKYALSLEKAKAFPKLTGDRRAFPTTDGRICRPPAKRSTLISPRPTPLGELL